MTGPDGELSELPAEIVLVSSYAEMRQRPNFHPRIEGHDLKFKRILGEYALAEVLACGLGICQQAHRHGFLIELADSRETNIGNVCASRYFGKEIVTGGLKAYRAVRNRQTTLELYRALLDRHTEFEQALDQYDAAVSWAYRYDSSLHAANVVPSSVPDALYRMAVNGKRSVVRSIELSDEEWRDLKATNPAASRYAQEHMGELDGLGVFEPELATAPRKLAAILKRIASAKQCEETDFAVVAKMVKDAGEIPVLLERVARFVSEARAFYTDRNVELLEHLAFGGNERARMRKLVWNHEKADIKVRR